MAAYFEKAVSLCDEPKAIANWMLGDFSAALNKEGIPVSQSPVEPQNLAGLVARITDGTLSSKLGKQVFEALWRGEGSADQIIEARGLRQVSDTGALEKLVADVMSENQDQVAQYRAADSSKQKKLIGFFVGQIMKASKGQANPQLINKILTEALDSD